LFETISYQFYFEINHSFFIILLIHQDRHIAKLKNNKKYKFTWAKKL